MDLHTADATLGEHNRLGKKESLKIDAWNASYQRGDNYIFEPSEEIVRFISKYIMKRVGLADFQTHVQDGRTPNVLDFGCGIGRHLLYGQRMGLRMFGIDLSEKAIGTAQTWLDLQSNQNLRPEAIVGNGAELPWEPAFFDFALSHGVLDSMSFDAAVACAQEIHRVLRNGGLFYCDLISGDDDKHPPDFAGEERVETAHEHGTIQSFFNFKKIKDLFEPYFSFEQAKLIRHQDLLHGGYHSRYHLVLRKLPKE